MFNIKLTAFFILTIIVLIFVSGCKIATNDSDIISEEYCNINEDCVPAECCHPTSCVNKAFRPDCNGIICTMECVSETMDCGQGECKCVNKECMAVI